MSQRSLGNSEADPEYPLYKKHKERKDMRVKNLYVMSIIIGLIGLILLLMPGTATMLVCRIMGIGMIIGALSTLFFGPGEASGMGMRGATIGSGILMGIIGLVFIINPVFVVSIIPIIMGIGLFINGLVNVLQSFQIKKAGGPFIIHFVMAIITCLLGILIFSNPFGTIEITLRVIGVILIVDALTNLFTTKIYYTQI